MDQAAPQGGQFNNPVFTPPFPFPPPPPTKPQPASPSPSTHFSSQQAVMVDVAATKVETTSPSEVGEETQKSQIEEAEPKKFGQAPTILSVEAPEKMMKDPTVQKMVYPEIVEENVDMSKLSFRKKVYYIVRAKGDRGVLPYLESIGIKPSSALLISRYLSSERLPVLIDKMEARHGGLNMLGQRDASFPYLIESFPKLLLCSVENHFKPLIHFLELVGVPKEGISTILLSFPPIIFYDIEKDMKPKMRALAKAGPEEKDIGKILLKYPWIISTSIQENYEKILTYFNQKKVPKVSVDLAIKSWPHILGCSTTKMNSIVEQYIGFRIWY
ncbi:mTERF domain-containing protein, mitochondrial [Canna indica]|uniref:mTERF domain-containing protein, mitochondrial n=1 Tax=Canna indica TaxID=4628 RepID=A0AAQ3K4R3_9LILI|nr:mTERF domain-containing protein, mitochondrial [Canna indica]